MGLRVKKIENNKQKMIITGLITSDTFCKEILPLLNYNNSVLLNNTFTGFYKIVIKWVSDFYDEYSKSPKQDIKKVYDQKVSTIPEDEADLIEQFLSTLSNHYERQDNYNEQYVIDQAFLYLRKSNLGILQKYIEQSLGKDNVTAAENYIEQFRHVKKETANIDSADVLYDTEEVYESLFQEEELLFQFPGALGESIGPFVRGDLVSFAGPAKRGKSWWLQEVGIKAMLAGLRVVVFSFEMPKHQCLRRMYQNFLGEVTAIPEDKDHVYVENPFFEETDVDNMFNISTEQYKKKGLDVASIKKKLKGFQKYKKGNGGIKLVAPPSYSMTPKAMEQYLDDLVLEGYTPDVIVVDYADILQPEAKSEYRHQIDSIWKGLRALAQRKHCLVVTATHTNKSTFGKNISQGDASEDSRKINHVSIMMGLNQTPQEKKLQLMRVNILAHRNRTFNVEDDIVCLQNLDIGKPCLASKHSRQVNYQKEKAEKKGGKK